MVRLSPVQRRDGLTFGIGQNVRVAFQHPESAPAKQLLNGPRVNAAAQKQGGRHVPQAVKGQLGVLTVTFIETQFFQSLPEAEGRIRAQHTVFDRIPRLAVLLRQNRGPGQTAWQ